MKINKVISLLACVVLLALLFIGGSTETSPRSFKEFWNLGHIALFLLLAYLLLTPPSALAGVSFSRQAALMLSLALGLGGVVEVLQATIGRSMDYADIIRNAIGALLGLVFFSPSLRGFSRRTLQALGLLLLAMTSTPFALALWDEQRALAQWPVLANFEDRVQLSRWSTTGNARLSLAKPTEKLLKPAMQVDFSLSQYSGASFDFFPGDWSAYSQLTIELYNPGTEPLTITCRIHDHLHNLLPSQQHRDRFNRSYQLQPGWNQLKINIVELIDAPSDRAMDIQLIDNLQLFVSRLTDPATVYISRIYLGQGDSH